MGDKVLIKTSGRLADTRIELNGEEIDPGNLIGLQLYYEPAVEQVGVEFNYVNKEGRTQRWSGANPDDAFNFFLERKREDGVVEQVTANNKGLSVSFDGTIGFIGCNIVVQLVADGYSVQLNRFVNLAQA